MKPYLQGLDTFSAAIWAIGELAPMREYCFAKPRRWRFDYAWPDYKIALEVEGGAWTHGRHTRGSGFVNDMEKYNTAILAGWIVLRVTPDQLLTHGPDLVKQALTMTGRRVPC